MKIDWVAEKTMLKFVHDEKVCSQPQVQWKSAGLNQGIKSSIRPFLDLRYKQDAIGTAFVVREKDKGIRIGFSLRPDAADSEFIKNSLFKVALLKLESQIGVDTGKVIFQPSNDLPMNFEAFGFQRNETGFELAMDRAALEPKIKLKKFLVEYLRAAPKVGRGFLLDASKLDPQAAVHLSMEYGDIAWGITNWARHTEIGDDEKKVIDEYCNGGVGLEIGAGSGRVTRFLVSRFNSLTATDMVASSLEHLKPLAAVSRNLELIEDDIMKSNLPDQLYDVAMFWENGLGCILTELDRRRAVETMAKKVKKGGLLILGVRNLLPVSVDHLMVAAQTELVMGIYHTFSMEEMRSFEGSHLKLTEIIEGSERPAGGKQVFYIYKKV